MKDLIKKILYKIPNFQKFYFSFKKKFLYDNPEFVGWGMTTHSIPPWRDQINSPFLKRFDKIEKNLRNKIINKEFNIQIWNKSDDKMLIMDTLKWRHYIICWAVNNIINKK